MVTRPCATPCRRLPVFFFFNDTATTEIYTLSLHDALPICASSTDSRSPQNTLPAGQPRPFDRQRRSEEHTSELQSHLNLVCRLLLEKKKISQMAIMLVAVSMMRTYAARMTQSSMTCGTEHI